jgi:hypothetical protein
MSFAVMQPYLFPHLGYYQLVNTVDKFVFYDDVTFIKGGYINRNNILSNGKSFRFSIPVVGMSSNKLINELHFDSNVKKTIKTFQQSYSKAPNYQNVIEIVEKVLFDQNRNVSHICSESIIYVFEYLNIDIDFFKSSDLTYDRNLSAEKKLFAISAILEDRNYINSPGGRNLYSKQNFDDNNVKLSFIDMQPVTYKQSFNEYIPNLSMIDVLMWNSKAEVIELLSRYVLD